MCLVNIKMFTIIFILKYAQDSIGLYGKSDPRFYAK